MGFYNWPLLSWFRGPRNSLKSPSPNKITFILLDAISSFAVDQTKWLVFRIIHVFRIPWSFEGARRLVDLDFLGKRPKLPSAKLTWQWKIHFSVGNASSNGPFSIAMLVYRNVCSSSSPQKQSIRRLSEKPWSLPKERVIRHPIASDIIGMSNFPSSHKTPKEDAKWAAHQL